MDVRKSQAERTKLGKGQERWERVGELWGNRGGERWCVREKGWRWAASWEVQPARDLDSGEKKSGLLRAMDSP